MVGCLMVCLFNGFVVDLVWFESVKCVVWFLGLWVVICCLCDSWLLNFVYFGCFVSCLLCWLLVIVLFCCLVVVCLDYDWFVVYFVLFVSFSVFGLCDGFWSIVSYAIGFVCDMFIMVRMLLIVLFISLRLRVRVYLFAFRWLFIFVFIGGLWVDFVICCFVCFLLVFCLLRVWFWCLCAILVEVCLFAGYLWDYCVLYLDTLTLGLV